eukprot:TRINITY_DN8119_c0_g1_i4.p1 TRINITY_DN8119_c0_g1~~TRINITY_DN8119_c0_g1_i4.p1  ORF type:complete len:178 (+),score=16.59 TRINITY_DN8119_c0_g1_i4:68-601(+)
MLIENANAMLFDALICVAQVPKELFSAFTNTMPIRFGGMYLCSPPWFMRLLVGGLLSLGHAILRTRAWSRKLAFLMMHVASGCIRIQPEDVLLALQFPLVKMFMKKKMQERMHIVTSLPDALTKYIAMEQIPDDLGGTYGYSRAAELDYNRLVATCHDQSKHPDPKHPSHKCSITDV